jgi:hypothetical protein
LLAGTHRNGKADVRRASLEIPAEVEMHGEWTATDCSNNYTLIEAPDTATVRRIQAPFAKFTETLIVPVTAISGWTAN